MNRVLLIGIKPEAVDVSDPVLPSGTTVEKIAAGIDATLADMKARSWEGVFCPVLADDNAGAPIAKSLAEHWDCIVIGGGIRIPSRSLHLFERIINAVHNPPPVMQMKCLSVQYEGICIPIVRARFSGRNRPLGSVTPSRETLTDRQ